MALGDLLRVPGTEASGTATRQIIPLGGGESQRRVTSTDKRISEKMRKGLAHRVIASEDQNAEPGRGREGSSSTRCVLRGG